MLHQPRIAFFGTPDLTLPVLDALHAAQLTPSCIITAPDRPVGRRQTITPPAAKAWATEHDVAVLQPESARDDDFYEALAEHTWDLFIVFAYGSILPARIIDLPLHHTLNLHPSLLPKLRGPSPIRSAILADMRHTGVTIMQMDERMDHGPIIAQEAVTIAKEDWPPYGPDLDTTLIDVGSTLLVNTIPSWLRGDITPTPQDEQQATYCQKLTKTDGELAIDPYDLPRGDEAYATLLRIRGMAGWPGTYFIHNQTRIKVCAAHIECDRLVITRIIPAGKQEMHFADYFAIHS